MRFFKKYPESATAASTVAALGADQALVWIDRAGTITDASAAFLALVGHARSAVIGAPLSRLDAEGNAEPWPDCTTIQQWSGARTLATATTGAVEARAHLAALRDTTDAVCGAVIRFEKKVVTPPVQSPITAAIYRAYAVIEFTPSGEIRDANEGLLKATGYSRSELVGQHHRILMPPGAAEAPAYAQFWTDLRAGRGQSGSFLRIGKDGRELWLQAEYMPLLGADGTVTGVLKLAQDVTAQKQQALDDAGQLAALHRSQAVIEFDVDGNILDANENFLSVMGYTRAEIVGKHHRIFIDAAEQQSEAYRAFWQDLRAGQHRVAEFRRVSKSGADVWIQATYTPILDARGKPYKVVKFATDVSARKRAVLDFQTAVGALAQGRLNCPITQPMPGDMEQLRRDYNGALERIGELVGALLDSLQSIQAETENLANASADLGRRTETQAASLEETAAAINELASSVDSSTSGAKTAAASVSQARMRSNAGRDVVARTITAMQDIATSSQQISKITAVIDDIAFQTNLLALNAGVEAARAGETGRGFAVVASEVRALAQRSSEAAREIAELIETSGRQVKEGVGLVNESGQALGAIDALVGEVDTLVQAIANSSAEQALGLSEISKAVNQLDQVTQQNAAMFEESSAAVAVLRDQAEALAREGAVFEIGSREAPTELRRAG